MRRFLPIVFIFLLITTLPAVMQSQGNAPELPGTNTPRPAAFATNTPAGPSATPTASATNTPSLTPSATPTATFTATSTPTATPTATHTPSPTPTPNGPIFYPEGINPLTGLPYPDEASAARRNLIVKISNYPPVVRPQTGVNLADVVYEIEAEGGVTRFAAIFRSNMPDHVGSVRSARLLDLELVRMYEALLAYSGTSEPIQRLLLRSDFVYQTFSPLKGDNCEEAGFCRFPQEGLALEHTMFLDTRVLYDLATRRNVNTGYRAKGFAFSETADSGGQPANDVFIDWYGQTDARWQYDETTGRYLRYTEGRMHIDKGDGEQLWADNLIIIQVPHEERPDLFPEGVTYESLEVQLWGQGPAMLVRDGQAYSGFWRRLCDQNEVTPTPTYEPMAAPEVARECHSKAGTALQIIYGDNTPMMMKPGRTWVSVVRGFGDVVISEDERDMVATGTAIALSATPTLAPTEGPSPTADPNS